MFNSICPERPWTQHVFRARRRDGVYIWIEGHYRHLVQNDGVLAIMRDITASKRAEEILAKTANQLEAENLTLLTLSQQDSLTGLANRRCFDERLEAEFARARRQSIPLGLVLLDVDRFKAYNDHYGHVAGDDCLRRVSAAFAGLVRRPGDLIARYGGEEFVALLAATDQGSAMMMAERMRASIEALQIEHVGSKFGIVMVCAGASALVPRDDRDTATKLLRAADKALYQAKSDGRNQARGNTQNLESIAEAAIAARRSAPIPSAPRSS
jgi:diguanylate cyclase (GGDEF)-like protein